MSEWRHNNGYLINHTMRIAKEDFDTNPSEEYKKEVFDYLCEAANNYKDLQEQLDKEKDNHAISIAIMGSAIAKNEKLERVAETSGKYILSLRQIIYAGELMVRDEASKRIDSESSEYTAALNQLNEVDNGIN